jgi:hypothetical protein
MKRKSGTGSKQSSTYRFGHYRKPQDVSEFKECFERRGDVAVLRGFLNGTATWVMENFAPLELEVYQAASLGRAARENNQRLDYETVRAQFPRLAILATNGDLKEIVESNLRPKEVAAGMLSRVLHREESSIKRWAQGKK